MCDLKTKLINIVEYVNNRDYGNILLFILSYKIILLTQFLYLYIVKSTCPKDRKKEPLWS